MNEEVRYFKHLGRAARILPLIIAGEPAASIGDKVRAPASEECFVPAMLHPLSADGTEDLAHPELDLPLGSDVRWEEEKREIFADEQETARPVLEHGKLHLLSGILGVDLDDLVQRDKARQLVEARAKARRARKLTIAFAVLSGAALVGRA